MSSVSSSIKVPEQQRNYTKRIDYSLVKMSFNFLILAIGAKCAFIGDVGRDIGRDDTLKIIRSRQGSFRGSKS